MSNYQQAPTRDPIPNLTPCNRGFVEVRRVAGVSLEQALEEWDEIMEYADRI
jgi:hypothetical protein